MSLPDATSVKPMDPSLWSMKQLRLDQPIDAERVSAYFENGWKLYETVMSSLRSEEDYYVQPNKLRHPLVFYLGHTATFFVNKFVAAGILSEEQRVNPHFEQLFAVGVDEMSWDDCDSSHYDWPKIDQLWDYRKKVHDLVLREIKATDWTKPVNWSTHRGWAIFMAMEHERIHLETSSVLIREMDVSRVVRPAGWAYAPSHGRAPVNDMIELGADQVVRIGKDLSFPTYGWDLEYGVSEAVVEPFSASRFLVSNGEWLHFINEKGYETQEYWDEEGWNWVQFTQAKHPHFWVPLDASKYRFRLMYDVVDMPWDWPVEVNHYEAKAYCRWKGPNYRLPTEYERRVMLGVSHQQISRDPSLDPGVRPIEETSRLYNADMVFGSSTPVNYYPPNELGFHDLYGNVWEWSDSILDGYPGYQAHPLYYDFSSPTFDNRHAVIMGGSWISTGNEASFFARYAFRKHFFQHAGFRLCKSLHVNVYESEKLLNEYLHFHYGTPQELIEPQFEQYLPKSALEYPARCAQKAISVWNGLHKEPAKRAMDMGCAVGRSSFELARLCQEVVGIDYSEAFASSATKLVETGSLPYRYLIEGERYKESIAKVDESIDRSRARFMQGDAHHIPEELGSFDILLGANLVDRLHTPVLFLRRLKTLINPGGIVMLTTPFTWLPDFTARENWIGGKVVRRGESINDSDHIDSATALKAAMEEMGFSIVEETDMPFLIRETRRKFQLTVAYCGIWQKK